MHVKLYKKCWPLLLGIGILWFTLLLLLGLSTKVNDGHLIYPLDDTYIHMTMAKNVAHHGVWGITPYKFSSSSSSLLWTLLLSTMYFTFGVNDVSPWIMNFILATMVLIVVHSLLMSYQLKPLYIFIVLVMIIFWTPLSATVFCAIEHTMHLLFTLLFVHCAAKIIASNRFTTRESMALFILGPIIVATRYEGLFLLLITCILFALRRKFLYTLSLGCAAIIPIGIFGLFSVSKGWYPLPNSVLMKGNVPNISSLTDIINSLGYHSYNVIYQTPHILALVLMALVLFVLQYNRYGGVFRDFRIVMTLIFIANTFLHMQYGDVGWFYRYEAYIVGLGLFVLGLSLNEFMPTKAEIRLNKIFFPKLLALVLIISLALSPLVRRGINPLSEIPKSTNNIYEQQYQMGTFLKEFYSDEVVVANDIGGLPSQWTKIGQWTISDNYICGDSTVSFYAIDPAEIDRLATNLKAFASQLPTGVRQSGVYLQ